MSAREADSRHNGDPGSAKTPADTHHRLMPALSTVPEATLQV
jgi:hypothetical protein